MGVTATSSIQRVASLDAPPSVVGQLVELARARIAVEFQPSRRPDLHHQAGDLTYTANVACKHATHILAGAFAAVRMIHRWKG